MLFFLFAKISPEVSHCYMQHLHFLCPEHCGPINTLRNPAFLVCLLIALSFLNCVRVNTVHTQLT